MALPKYKEVKGIVEKTISTRFQNVMKSQLIPFDSSPNIIQHEGKKLIHNTLDDQSSQKTINYQKAAVEHKIDLDKIADLTLEEIIAIIDEKAKDMGGQMARHHLKVISDVVEETGNSVDASGNKLSPDLFLEAISKMSISFDENGEPNLPTMIISQKMSEDWRRMAAEADADPKHAEKFEAIMKKKKEEYDAEQASRKLVD